MLWNCEIYPLLIGHIYMEDPPVNPIPRDPPVNNNHGGHEENISDNIVQDVARPELL